MPAFPYSPSIVPPRPRVYGKLLRRALMVLGFAVALIFAAMLRIA